MCPRVDFGAETCKVGSRKWNERFKLNHVPLLRVPAPIGLIQFDCVVLRSDGQPHSFTIGGQQDRLNSHPALVSNRHQHRSPISWLFGENDAVGVARIRCSLWLGTWPRWLLDAGRETTGSDRSRRSCAGWFGRRSRHQLRSWRFFSRYLICLTWAESNPRAVPTSRLDRPAIRISRAASVLVFVYGRTPARCRPSTARRIEDGR